MLQLPSINCGLHDIKRDPGTGGIQIPPEQYRANLQEIVNLLQSAEKRMLWIRTTPVDEARHLRGNASFHRREADLADYNRIADDVMDTAGVTRIDVHGFTFALPGELYRDHVHFHPDILRAHAGFMRREFDRILRPASPPLHTFLGDSITDASRDRDDPASLGTGYVNLLAHQRPGERFLNLGIELDPHLATMHDISQDGVHPNEKGHRLIAGLLK